MTQIIKNYYFRVLISFRFTVKRRMAQHAFWFTIPSSVNASRTASTMSDRVPFVDA